VIQQSSAEISEIINRVSFVLRASADPHSSAPIAMNALVGSVLHQLEPDIAAAGAEVTQPESWPTVDGVAAWLQVVWWNFLHNAVRHGGPAARVRISWKAEKDGYRFSISDKGPGVSPDRLANLFSPFDHLHATQTTGLGLPIAQRLILLQKGTCAYEPHKGGGANFSFSLPAAEAVK